MRCKIRGKVVLTENFSSNGAYLRRIALTRMWGPIYNGGDFEIEITVLHISRELARCFYQTPKCLSMGNLTMRILFVSVAAAASVLVSSPAFCWGQKGHQMVNQVAVSLVANPQAAQFMRANQKQVIAFASTPDLKWKSGASADKEKPMHWFQMDRYEQNPLGDGLADLILGNARQKLGDKYMIENGLAMWRVSNFYDKLVVALKNRDWQKAVQIGGVMGHYVGDMTQPMHATANYDGQSINKPGIHKYYETTLVDHIDAGRLASAVLASGGPRRSELERAIGNNMNAIQLQHVAYSEAAVAYDGLEPVLNKFVNNADDAWLTTDLQPRLARASALLAKIWDVAFVTAGVQAAPSSSVNASEPAWVPLN